MIAVALAVALPIGWLCVIAVVVWVGWKMEQWEERNR